ncbi:MAG: SagB family peptide dehydrogenase [Candidatus Obscuribacterales bacterium]|nr:SagB family peptide dehydrogenase [Candidatus Obscuribacterales bacterium]
MSNIVEEKPVSVADSEIYAYHRLSKHTVESLFSRGTGLDWSNQPDPFLTYSGTDVIELPLDFVVSSRSIFETISESICEFYGGDEKSALESGLEIEPGGLGFLSNLLYYATAISAWKQIKGTDHKWALRVNASSGNLHPTETYLLLREDFATDLAGGFYHYRVDRHHLERLSREDLLSPIWQALELKRKSPPLLICLGSVIWREVWKYKQRGYRYCQHDLGHALAALSLSAQALGWRIKSYGLFPDAELSCFLGMEEELVEPLLLMALCPGDRSLIDETTPDKDGKKSDWTNRITEIDGRVNQISSSVKSYPEIVKAHGVTSYSQKEFDLVVAGLADLDLASRGRQRLPGAILDQDQARKLSVNLFDVNRDYVHKSVHETIRKRRSAVDMDGATSISVEHLEAILTFSTGGFHADFQSPDRFEYLKRVEACGFHMIHLYLYIHRVEGLLSGLYYFDRFKQELIPLLLQDQKEIARSVSCFQDIAADGAFALSMVADMEMGFALFGQRFYRLVHFEAGFIGQLLYLNACALGYDSTGIGCFLDDAINEYLSLSPGFEVIYNFTFGKAVLDLRLTTLKSYAFPEPI